MDFFNSYMMLGIAFAVVHGIYVHRLGNYIKKYHHDKWQEIIPMHLFGISSDTLEARNYFSEMRFVFSSDNMDDDNILSFKRKIKLFLAMAIISWLFLFFAPFFS